MPPSQLRGSRSLISRAMPLLILTIASLLSLSVWMALRGQEQHQVDELLQAQATSIRNQLQHSFLRQVRALKRMADRWHTEGGTPQPRWLADSRNLLRDYDNFQAIEWVDPSFRIRWIEPLQGNEAALGYNVAYTPERQRALEQARDSGTIDNTPVVELQQGGLGMVVYVPIGRAAEFDGFIVGVFTLKELIDSLLSQIDAQYQDIWIYEENRLIYGNADQLNVQEHSASVTFMPFQLQWRLVVSPDRQWLARNTSMLPEFVLAFGLILGILLAWLTRFAVTLSAQAAALSASNGSLEREMQERQRVQDTLSHMATHDTLTGLPNRSFFQEDLAQALELAGRQQTQLAVLMVDLDHFKTINDTLGHRQGDQLLQQVVERLRSRLTANTTLARAGGDEFMLMLEKIGSMEEVISFAAGLLQVFSRSFALDQQEVFITTSIGIALYPDAGTNAETLIRNADAALYKAKDSGRNEYQFFTTGMHHEALRRLELDKALHSALENEEFLLYYQPKIDLASGRIVGAEALIRWQRPGQSMVPPNEFIPLAEDTGLILEIGDWVLETACRQLQQWQQAPEFAHLSLAINLSGRQLRDQSLLDDVRRHLRTHQIPVSQLEFELTEEVFIENVQDNQNLLQAIRDLGIQLSIDDFGIGYSSLSYLKHFPINSLKVDRSFVLNVTRNRDDAIIVRAVVSLAHALQLKVVAEGVETAEHVAFLRELQCDQAQGFHFARPMPLNEFEAFVRQQGR